MKAFRGTSLVSFREFYMKDGKLLPGSKGDYIIFCLLM